MAQFTEEHIKNMCKPKSEEHKQSMRKSKEKEHIKNMKISAKKRIERNVANGGQIRPNYSPEACIFFDKFNDKTSINIKHAENGGEYYIKDLGYYVDGYNPEYNIVWEWDNLGHYDNGKLKQKDIDRQTKIEKYLGCIFIRINANSKTIN